jgi:capping protein alpha
MAEFDGETSDAEKLQIAQHFLLSSPPGQFNEVRTDVQKILPDDLLTEALATGIAKVANTKNSKVVTAPSGSKVVLNAAGEIDATHYFDPSSGSVMTVDHLTLATQADETVKSNQDPTETFKGKTNGNSLLFSYF